jgi:hypothetical protein
MTCTRPPDQQDDAQVRPDPGKDIAGSTWTRVSRQLVNTSLTPSKSIAKAPTARVRGASQGRARLSRMTASSTTVSSLSLTARMNRMMFARVTCGRRGRQ